MNKTISVYFSGTGFSINDPRFLSTALFRKTEESERQIKMGFHGCGVDYGFTGLIFGSGLDEQCQKVIVRVLQEINQGHNITLNIYGHSRGGIAALMVAKQLKNIDKEKLAINLALLDPVPGNFITTSSLDPFKLCLANKVMDLSECKPLRKVLALYPHIPLPDIACHAPLLATYPKDTEVDEEIVAGCHAQAEHLTHPASTLVEFRVEEFLVKNGTQLQTSMNYNDTEEMKRIYQRRYQFELGHVDKHATREVHSSRNVMISTTNGAKYLNEHHKKLAGDTSDAPVALKIQPEQGIFSWFKKLNKKYPKVSEVLQWGMIALSVTSLLYFTGGLAAFWLIAPAVAKLGAFSIFTFAPAIGGLLATTWHYALKPILSWGLSKLFYPHYAIQTLEAPKTNIPSSSKKLISLLGERKAEIDALSRLSAPHHRPSPLRTTTILPKETLEQQNQTCLQSPF